MLNLIVASLEIQIISFVILIFGIAFRSLFKFTDPNSASALSLIYNISFFVIVFTLYYSQFFSLWSVKFTIIFVNFIACSVLIYKIFFNNYRKFLNLIILNQSVTLLPLLLIAPGIYFAFKFGSDFSLVSYGNNDIAYYISVAHQFTSTGFNDSNMIDSNNLNYASRFTHYFTPTALISFMSVTTQIHIFNTAVPILILSGSYVIFSSARLSKAIYPQIGLRTMLFVGFFVLFSSLISYIYSAFFLTQMIATGISLNLIAVILEYLNRESGKQRFFIEFTILNSLCFITYPAFLVPFIFATLMIFLSHFIFSKQRKIGFKFKPLIYSLFLSFILVSGYSKSVYTLLSDLSSLSFGWSIPSLDPFKIFIGLNFIPREYSSKVSIILWIIFFLVIIFTLFFSKVTRVQKFSFSSIMLVNLSGVLFILFRNSFDLTNYTSWKSISYLIPIFLTTFIPLFLFTSKLSKYVLVSFVGMLIINPLIFWYDNRPAINYVSGDLTNIDLTGLVSKNSLNLNANPAFETMLLTVLLEKKILYINSDSYLHKSFSDVSCTLTRVNLINDLDAPFAKKVNKGFYLIPSKFSKTC